MLNAHTDSRGRSVRNIGVFRSSCIILLCLSAHRYFEQQMFSESAADRWIINTGGAKIKTMVQIYNTPSRRLEIARQPSEA